MSTKHKKESVTNTLTGANNKYRDFLFLSRERKIWFVHIKKCVGVITLHKKSSD